MATATQRPADSPANPASVRDAAARIVRDVGFVLQSPTLAANEHEHAALLTAASVAGEVADGDRSA